MDLTFAIEWNTAALKRIVATLFAMAGLGAAPTSPSRGEVATRSGAGGGDALSHGGGDAAHPTPERSLSSGLPKAKPGVSDPPPRGEGDVFRPTLPRRLHRAVLRLLCPAEAAVRRLIVIAARGLVAQPPPPRPRRPPKPASIFLRRGSIGTGILAPRGALSKPHRPAPRAIALPLFDRVKRPFERRRPPQICVPRISCPDPFATLSPIKLRRPPEPDDPLDATRLALRIRALAAALDDLPAQANRFARWRARRDAEGAQEQDRDAEGAPNKIRDAEGVQSKMRDAKGTAPINPGRWQRRFSPLRPGRPPGLTRRLESDMHGLLTDLHGLAFDVIEHPDTS